MHEVGLPWEKQVCDHPSYTVALPDNHPNCLKLLVAPEKNWCSYNSKILIKKI